MEYWGKEKKQKRSIRKGETEVGWPENCWCVLLDKNAVMYGKLTWLRPQTHKRTWEVLCTVFIWNRVQGTRCWVETCLNSSLPRSDVYWYRKPLSPFTLSQQSSRAAFVEFQQESQALSSFHSMTTFCLKTVSQGHEMNK